MSAGTVVNGKPRRQLSDQLDRLDAQLLQIDRVLDGLSEGLDGAVRDAVKEGTRIAVKEAVVTLLTDPGLRDALHQASTPPMDPKPSFWARLKAKVHSAATQVKGTAGRAFSAMARGVTGACTAAGRLLTTARQSRQVRAVATIAVGVGAILALARSVAALRAGTMLLAARTFVTERAVRIREWVRSAVLRLQPT
jgi:hypothetical protein